MPEVSGQTSAVTKSASAAQILRRFGEADSSNQCNIQDACSVIVGKNNGKPAARIKSDVVAGRRVDFRSVSGSQTKWFPGVHCFAYRLGGRLEFNNSHARTQCVAQCVVISCRAVVPRSRDGGGCFAGVRSVLIRVIRGSNLSGPANQDRQSAARRTRFDFGLVTAAERRRERINYLLLLVVQFQSGQRRGATRESRVQSLRVPERH